MLGGKIAVNTIVKTVEVLDIATEQWSLATANLFLDNYSHAITLLPANWFV